MDSLYTLTVTDEFVRIEHPRRRTEQIRWDDIDIIWLINTDEGPLRPEIFMGLGGADENTGGCLIPIHECDGYEQVYDIVSKWDGFHFENYIHSMSCTDNKDFYLWHRKSAFPDLQQLLYNASFL